MSEQRLHQTLSWRCEELSRKSRANPQLRPKGSSHLWARSHLKRLASAMLPAPPGRREQRAVCSEHKVALQPIFGFSFSPGALLMPYHVGVAQELAELSFINDTTPLAGTSAGSILVSCIAGGVPYDSMTAALKELIGDLRQNGTLGRVAPLLRTFLEELLPADIHTRMTQRSISVGITKVQYGNNQRPLRGLTIRNFYSKEDVINAITASGWTPFWIGNGLTVEFRDYGPCIDGMPTVLFPEPAPQCSQVVKVCSTSSSILTRFGIVEQNEVQICPDLQRKRYNGQMKFSAVELALMALNPYEDDVIDELVALGREDAAIWANSVGECNSTYVD
ncbi:hypothetical protein CYMTET_20166 [Cymbomonas tetramitiformis]|uniref:Patatin n=1 Tax=Cymbomonas tetramitiformis TaxID=36881 RepID=A0AAE0L4F8_9CHLO|nr:hypothetical protein CYMTET_20166 [Cymbomonas tetramitiformis]